MKKAKRILALSGACLLFALYICTLIFALIDNPACESLFRASLACTIILPVLLYGYMIVYRITKNDSQSDDIDSDN